MQIKPQSYCFENVCYKAGVDIDSFAGAVTVVPVKPLYAWHADKWILGVKIICFSTVPRAPLSNIADLAAVN